MSNQSTATPAVESRQHLLQFADRCVALRLDDQEDSDTLRGHAIALTTATHGAVRCLGVLATTLPDSNHDKDVFIESISTLIEFAMGASVALQFDAYENDKADRLAAMAQRGGAK